MRSLRLQLGLANNGRYGQTMRDSAPPSRLIGAAKERQRHVLDAGRAPARTHTTTCSLTQQRNGE